MPKIAKPLNDLQVRRIAREGWHAVGGVAGLLLQVRKPAQDGAQIPRSWILRVKVGDERQPIGLGPYPQVAVTQQVRILLQFCLMKFQMKSLKL